MLMKFSRHGINASAISSLNITQFLKRYHELEKKYDKYSSIFFFQKHYHIKNTLLHISTVTSSTLRML